MGGYSRRNAEQEHGARDRDDPVYHEHAVEVVGLAHLRDHHRGRDHHRDHPHELRQRGDPHCGGALVDGEPVHRDLGDRVHDEGLRYREADLRYQHQRVASREDALGEAEYPG